MKIIDSNKDFYDFYQNVYRDSSLTFDRRDSYVLAKDEFARYFYFDSRANKYWSSSDKFSKEKYILLQVCNSFWLFMLSVTETDQYGVCKDYDITMISSWKDYSYDREIMKLSHIAFGYSVKNDNANRIESIKRKEHRELRTFNKFVVSKSNGTGFEHDERHIPILQHIGVAKYINPLDIYMSLEEYFSSEKTVSERTESIGLTNDERITNHGFDLKSSFRGKQT